MGRFTFNDKLDGMFAVSGEMRDNNGEDSLCFSKADNSAMIGVFDGCGGLGSQSYKRFGKKTGAYIASRTVSGAVYRWFIDVGDVSDISTKDNIAEEVRRYISKGFTVVKPYIQSNQNILGSMVRELPTTAAICIADDAQDGVNLNIFWAGDSRVYLIDEEGLAQLTEDDIDGEDAFTNLTNDGVLTNLIAADGRYDIHTKNLHLSKPTLVFAATDGCFGYIQSPMEFEAMLQEAFASADSMEGAKSIISEGIGEVTGDDFSFVCMSFLFGSYEAIKHLANENYRRLDQRYLKSIPSDYDEVILGRIWEKYRKGYSRYLEMQN